MDRSCVARIILSTYVEITILRLVELISEMMGSRKSPIIQSIAKAEIKHMRLDTAQAKRCLGWHPKWDFERALRHTIDWYKKHKSLFSDA